MQHRDTVLSFDSMFESFENVEEDEAIYALRPGRRSTKKWMAKCFSLQCSMSFWDLFCQFGRGGEHGAGWGGYIFSNLKWKFIWSHHRVA